MAVTQTTQIDPTIQPFLSFGLGEAQRLYQAGGPQFFTGDTFVRPSETTRNELCRACHYYAAFRERFANDSRRVRRP